jgi:hypothetical protein
MIVPSLGVKVLIAMKPVDFRNYAVSTIMLSRRRRWARRRRSRTGITLHNRRRF